MRSCLYRGTVWHRRTEPAYEFQYSVWYLGLDMDELDEVDTGLRLFSHNHPNLTSLWDADYIALRDGIEAHARGIQYARAQVVTMPRLLGFVFNPVSFFLLRDAEGLLIHVLAEVHNTGGERHVYGLPPQPVPDRAGGVYRAEAEKVFYVSPFIDMEQHYEVSLKEGPRGRLRITLAESNAAEGRFFEAGIDVDPVPLSERTVLWLLLRFPFVNFKTVAAIHWQGLKLWWRGERFRPNPSRAKERGRRAADK